MIFPVLLKSLDIFIFSSLNESFGIAVIEAMLSGIPVVLTDIPTLLEISDNGNMQKYIKEEIIKI